MDEQEISLDANEIIAHYRERLDLVTYELALAQAHVRHLKAENERMAEALLGQDEE